ncbi:MAG: aspartate-semialdehyde dehydrogenase [Holosporaceae bacterium]|jgi:aspartate-semialdehyde dehydrogenase|nr:aspartate-semialdehyde dehydrogenase [Holosporaceae bacterium]
MYNIAVIGATGNAGSKTLEILAERNFPVKNIIAIASENSTGKKINFKDTSIVIKTISSVDFSDMDIAIFCAGSTVSSHHAEMVTKAGCIIIDKTSYFRLNPMVPLIIPEVNRNDLLEKGAPLGIISTPNCVAVPLAMTLKALSQISTIKKIVVSTYQSVSGAGYKAMEELKHQCKSIVMDQSPEVTIFPKQIALNVIPKVGSFYDSGVSEEEDKISGELRKILQSNMEIAITCVRVPVLVGHSASVFCEFDRSVTLNDARTILEKFNGIVLTDELVSPIDVARKNEVYVGRLRKSTTGETGLLYWVVSDNLRKGAALNSVQIAEAMILIDPSLSKFRRIY